MKKISMIIGCAVLICCTGCMKGNSDLESEDKNKAVISGIQLAEQSDNAKSAVIQENMEIVTFESVTISFPDENHEYIRINDVISNKTKYDISGYKHGMLAFDEDGNPLELHWNGMDSSVVKSFYHSYETDTVEIKSNKESEATEWTLFSNIDGEEKEFYKIKYILYCFEEITFDDGRIWENENYDSWVDTYTGKKIDVNELDAYYPSILHIEF